MIPYKVLYLNEGTGERGRLPDFGITNIGGTIGPTFFVGGKPLIFADGTSTDGSSTVILNISLQGVYDTSPTATIDLSAGKHFTINALNQKIFQVDADTGSVTITGDLTVLGSSTVVEGTLANVDQVIINPPNNTTSGLIIEPMVGVTMSTDIVRIRALNAGPAVFTIDATGNTFLKQLSVAGTINGVNLSQFYTDFQAHVNNIGTKHSAEQISVDETNLQNVNGANVQEALESIDSTLEVIASSGATIQAHEHVQNTPSVSWVITHAKNSMRPSISIYDDINVLIYPDEISIVNANTVTISFNTPQAGRAVILLF